MVAFGRRKNRLSGGFYPNLAKPDKVRTPHQSAGFYPSAMGSILTTGPVFVGAAIYQGRRLLQNNTKRMASRSASRKGRKATTRRSKRT